MTMLMLMLLFMLIPAATVAKIKIIKMRGAI